MGLPRSPLLQYPVPMKVRSAGPADVPRIVELWREMWDLHGKLDPGRYVATAAAENVVKNWAEENIYGERSIVLVAEGDAAIVAYLLGTILENPPVVPQQFFGYVSELSVTESERGKGIGKALLAAANDWFRGKGLEFVELNVSTLNADAVRFWRREGYSDYLARMRMDL